jgi:hypothetical protein
VLIVVQTPWRHCWINHRIHWTAYMLMATRSWLPCNRSRSTSRSTEGAVRQCRRTGQIEMRSHCWLFMKDLEYCMVPIISIQWHQDWRLPRSYKIHSPMPFEYLPLLMYLISSQQFKSIVNEESQSWIAWLMTLLFCSERRLMGKKNIRYQVFITEWCIGTSYSTSWIGQSTTLLHGTRSTL